MKTWWYVHVPVHLAGSGGNTLVGKVEASEAEIREAFGDCATIDGQVVRCFKRPRSSR